MGASAVIRPIIRELIELSEYPCEFARALPVQH